MAIHGKFEVNNADFSPLTMNGVGTFMAFSGNDKYRNKGGCVLVPNNGPIPAGRYWIVDRPTGGLKSIAKSLAKDLWNSVAKQNPSNHFEWFALYRDDGQIDDYTWIEGVSRGNFRLHPIGGAGLSLGCITLQRKTDFSMLRNILLNTQKIPVNNSAKLMAYGSIEVITHGKNCDV
ncbi:DUF2778 domain-containing protein [Brenneria tiliae]|uniref:DUF2778 domain-containing protein n=1 Tax=Brenneria tiliae TaxID=2914984 RepID=UPI002014D479|nr:DUF2778 domain-containing protein [Brenneria tiliae]MCL2898527.1 DUF2778 domain-containing protein [Brenneria tiliae]MCL2902930.1 DUF2778 domain-containing protein [Brenneria tiliae]